MAFQIDRVTAANTSSASRFFGPVWAAAAALALTLGAMPASAQDVPWGQKPATKKPAKKPTAKKPTAKKPVDQKKLAEQRKLAAKKRAEAKKRLEAQRKLAAQKRAEAQKRLAEQKKLAAQKRAEAQKKLAEQKLAAKKLAAQKLAEQKKATEAPEQAKPAKEAAEQKPAQPQKLTDELLLSHFHKTLDKHGTWRKDSTYGDVWVPSEKEVGKSFAPYRTDGRWALTKDGSWAWASDHKWGNIPFHYGRWVKTNDQRHAWIPGTKYAPAWVVWRTADDARQFVGWAPMAPMHHWMNTSAEQQWNFVPTRNLFGPKVDNFVIRDKQMAATMLSQSRILSGHSDVQGVRSGVLKAASPTLKEGNVPYYAAPKTRMNLANQAIAPITAEVIRLANMPKPAVKEGPVEGAKQVKEGSEQKQPEQEVASGEPEPESRFATPPPTDEDEDDEGQIESFQQFKHRARRARKARQTRRAARRARIRRALRANRRGTRHRLPVYRCGWTNSRPRKWRCGPATLAPRWRR